jgi:phage portal protein BeeE
MLGSLTRLARELGSYSGDASIGEAATTMPIRRIAGAQIDNLNRPDRGMDEQMNSFRGTVYAAVDKVGRRIAQLPLHLYQNEHIGNEQPKSTQVYAHPFLSLFSCENGRKPHPEFNVYDFWYSHSISLDMTGESWWLVERDLLGRPARVTPLPANRMTIVFSKETGMIAGHFFCPKGTTPELDGIFIPKRDWQYLQEHKTEPFVVFQRYPSPRGIEDPRGWSPIKAAAYSYDINLFEHIYKRNFLQQGAQLGGILQSEVALSSDQISEYLEQFKNRHSGLNKAGLPMVLPKMLKWETTEPTPRDMQWAEAVSMTQSEILQIYGISDAKLGRADIGNRNTADAMDVTFNREVIQSRCDQHVACLNTDFLPIYPGQSESIYFYACFEDPVPADSEQQLKKERQDIEMNIRTRNELRQERGLKPFGKFGDQTYMPLTHMPVDPFASNLEISQDDADKMGFIDPAEQAKLDQATAAASADSKANQDAKDAKKTDAKKSDSKNGY